MSTTNGLGSIGPTAAGDQRYWSDQMRRQIEAESQAWSHAALEDGITWLTRHAHLVERLADCLLEAGDLSGPELLEHKNAVESLSDPLPSPPLADLFKSHGSVSGLMPAEPSSSPHETRQLHRSKQSRED